MAQLWTRASSQWAVLALTGTRFALADLPLAAGAARPAAVLVRGSADDRADWQLLARPSSGVAVNGLPLAAGMRTLLDQDEIRVPSLGALFFSTERLARVEPLPVAGHDVACPRCRQPIVPGTPAVRCPGCEVWHHGSAELPCWSYAATCALCRQETAADAGYKWTPEGL
jgi:hypothetical protein